MTEHNHARRRRGARAASTDWLNVPHPSLDGDPVGFSKWRDAFFAHDPDRHSQWLDDEWRRDEPAAMAKLAELQATGTEDVDEEDDDEGEDPMPGINVELVHLLEPRRPMDLARMHARNIQVRVTCAHCGKVHQS